MSDQRLGPTGNYPDGKLASNDGGELVMGIGRKEGKIFVKFGTHLSWFAVGPATARHLAQLLLNHAELAEAESRLAREIEIDVKKE